MKFCDFVPRFFLKRRDWTKLKPFLSETHINTLHLEAGCVEFYIGLDSEGPYIRVRYPTWSKEVKLYFLEVLEEDLFDVFCSLLIPAINYPYPEPYLLTLQLCFVRFTEIWSKYSGYQIVFNKVLANL